MGEVDYEVLREYLELEMLCIFRIKYVDTSNRKQYVEFLRLQYDLFLDCQEYVKINTRLRLKHWKFDTSGWKLKRRLRKELNSIYKEAYEDFIRCTEVKFYVKALSRIPEVSFWSLEDLRLDGIDDLLFILPLNE